ncbi:MAG TPA: hypothetical protein IAB84_12055 [Candidatus Choladousia intestinigallinarum]|nr:hypothetical protein [Candidatus Choladousia intestinigallinarum]
MDEKRLESFEKMLDAVEAEYQSVSAKLEELKDAGRTKSATYRQLFSRKLMYQNMLSLYQIYGLTK